MADARREHLIRFYSLLDRLEKSIGGARTLAACSGRMDWPKRGVYFFRESGEVRTDTGDGPRIVRVGTHALKTGARTKLWGRLRQHKGRARSGAGDHRSSIFRLIIGTALISRHSYEYSTWGTKKVSKSAVKQGELVLECEVSKLIGNMPFLWLSIGDDAGPESRRDSVERNAIALLSNYGKPPLDPPSPEWLGRHCHGHRLRDSGQLIRESGLWNSDHVDTNYDPAFLDELDWLISAASAVP